MKVGPKSSLRPFFASSSSIIQCARTSLCSKTGQTHNFDPPSSEVDAVELL